eukprot:g3818.t1
MRANVWSSHFCVTLRCSASNRVSPLSLIRRVHRTRLRTKEDDEIDGSRPIDEETLARLQKAEEEASRLRREIASLRSTPRSKEEALSRAGRTFWSSSPSIDSNDLKRETIFESNENWLSETDVDFIMGENGNGISPEDQAIVNRRLIVGGTLTVVFLVFAFIPSERFQLMKPKGELIDYLVPILRARDLLQEAQPVIEEANWDALRLIIDRILNPPNKLQSNLESSIVFLDDEDLRRRGRGLGREVLEFVQEMDYNKYFEDRLNVKQFRGGNEEAQFVEFSTKATQAAMIRLDQFLNLFSKSNVESARNKSHDAGTSSGSLPSTRAVIQQKSEFTKKASDIGLGIHKTSLKLQKLAQLAKRTSMFDDPTQEINELTGIVKQDIEALHKSIADLQQLSSKGTSLNGGLSGVQEQRHSANVVDNLRNRLKDTTKEFKDVLTIRSENLKDQNQRRQIFSSVPENGVNENEPLLDSMTAHDMFGGEVSVRTYVM